MVTLIFIANISAYDRRMYNKLFQFDNKHGHKRRCNCIILHALIVIIVMMGIIFEYKLNKDATGGKKGGISNFK